MYSNYTGAWLPSSQACANAQVDFWHPIAETPQTHTGPDKAL